MLKSNTSNFMLKNKTIIILNFVSVIFLMTAIAVVYFMMQKTSHPIIFNYGDYSFPHIFGSFFDAWKIVALGTGIFMANLFLSFNLFYKEKILSYLVLSASVVTSTMILTAVLRVAMMN